MRQALAQHDFKTVYQRLHGAGLSYRAIGERTGQAPSEIYSVLRTGRRITSYEVLVRIARGLAVPRSYMGLAYDETANAVLDHVGEAGTDAEEGEEVRQLLAHAAKITMGAGDPDVSRWWQPVESMQSPVPSRVGVSDVETIEEVTASMRALDYRYGGGACQAAVAAEVRWAQQLLNAACSDDAQRRLHQALADLHNLAGWTSFDVGLHSAARRHFARALEQARHAEDASLVANVLYRMGRLHLHRGMLKPALRFFQLGQIAAQDSGSELTVALLCANEAWAYGLLGDATQAMKSIGRANDEFSRADLGAAPIWVRFFGEADLTAMTGMVHAALPHDEDDGDVTVAVEKLSACLDLRDNSDTRSRTFELTALATAHLRLRNLTEGVTAGHQAADLAERVRSVRTIDRLAPLQDEADRFPHDPDVRELAHRIATLRRV
ncbi:transcriptional regulator [Dactylosporangium sp. NPDC051485]|uniref:tetratricopeptide repeat protein n=1 Tax=Dactylosporangium sp. NPDC051485 TaxID=3154846 RepID=UPI00344AB463